MKKSLFSTLALTALLFGAASCSNQDVAAPEADGPVTFSIALPGDFTRAISDGETATQLTYAVYVKGETTAVFSSKHDGDPKPSFSDKKATLSLNLAKGKEYDCIFWADKPDNSVYTFSEADKTITISYDGIVSNDEDRDAFFAAETIKVTGAATKTIELRRPFAQLNFATSDLDAAKKAGFEFGGSRVTVSNVYTKLNLLSGKASEGKEVTFAYAPKVVDGNAHKEVNGKTYDWLSMNYLLTGDTPTEDNEQTAESELVDLVFVAGSSATADVNTVNVSQVPVQRNYRTNIYGALLTSPVDFNIVIAPIYYEDDNNVKYEAVAANTNEELTAAIAAGAENIVLGEGTFTLTYNQATAAKNLKIAGAGKDKTTVGIPESIYTEGKSVSFSNLTYTFPKGQDYTEFTFGFLHRTGDVHFDNCKINGSLRLNISAGHKATINNCEFKVDTKVGMDGYSLYYYANTGSKMEVSNSTFNGVSKAILVYNEGPMVFDLTVNKCNFNATEQDGKCAVEIHTECGITGTVRINNSTATNFAAKNKGLWNELNNTTKKDTNNFDIYVDGVLVH